MNEAKWIIDWNCSTLKVFLRPFLRLCFFVCFFGLCRFWTGQNIESQIWLYSVRWGENKWPVRPLGVELQCGGLQPLCKGLFGGSSVERELDSLPECLRWWWSGWPPWLVTMWVIPDFRIWVIFLQGGGGEQKFTRLSASNFRAQQTMLLFFLVYIIDLKEYSFCFYGLH